MILIGLILNADEPPVGIAFTAADVDSNGTLDVSVSHNGLGRSGGFSERRNALSVFHCYSTCSQDVIVVVQAILG